MAAEDLKSFTIQTVLASFLMLSLLAFAISFMFYNNPTGFSDADSDVLESAYSSSNSVLTESQTDANNLLNITSNTNPEVSDLGSRDSVATSFSATGVTKKGFESARELISWVFTGTTGKILIGVLGGLICLLSYFFIYKHIRQGN